MNIKGVPVQKIFSIPNIIYFIIKVLLYSIFVLFLIHYTIDTAHKEHFNTSYKHLNNIYLNYYKNDETKKLVCLALDCEYVVEFENKDIKRVLKNTENKFLLLDLNKDNIEFMKKSLADDKIFYRNDAYIHSDKYYNQIRNELSIVLIVLFIIIGFPSHFFLCFLRIYKGQTDQNYYKSQLENSLQRDLTENLHHELIPCVMGIESSIKNVYANIFPTLKIVDFNNLDLKTDYVKPYIKKGSKITPDNIKNIINNYEFMNLSISKMVSTLNIVGKTKHVKTGNGTISLQDVIENAINGINSLELKKIELSYGEEPEKQKKLFGTYSVGYEMDNGMMMCILHNIIKNSAEALATKIEFTGRVDDKYMYIKIKDNGRGIRDKYNKILKKEDYKNIFINGYTTKDINGVSIKEKRKIIDIISKTFWKMLGIKDQYTSERGIGLNLNRKLLNSVGGDIVVLDTYYEVDKDNKTVRKGTELEIKFPYKFTKKY